ncbi:hypothetical protein [Sphingobacterium sp. UBA1498]|uniref:hypothetical protein n=1 Tax=Sphingobacterium sp. UBA1498 TaxID=1947481 RepID=UPI0025CDA2F4|nr:hypothetical protein [Sphingobacterium sp. UBA1498]
MKSITPGLNSSMNLAIFTSEEKEIIRSLGKEWYITNAGGRLTIGNRSYYKYFLMKPTSAYQELFNIEREIVVVFSDYENFEPRSLDAFDSAINVNNELRIERACGILISRDRKIETKITRLLKSDPEHQAIVPFTYEELSNKYDSFFIQNRFKEHFYSRDLFAFNSALKKDLYFFGRTDLIYSIINRHKSNENSGLFGLRKTGKTSLVYGIQRAIKNSEGISIFLDCQSPNFHAKKWNKALYLLIAEIKSQNNLEILLKNESEYSEENAASAFEKDLIKLHKKLKNKNILLIFDEIEHITPEISLSQHWKNGRDFVLFWQTLRSLFQKYNNLFSYLIVGTNPKCVETPFINGVDNPIYMQIPHEYIQPFDVPQTKDMIRRIGSIMGLNFDEGIYSKLHEDFGGHPFLMRNVCSVINTLAPKERPVRIDKTMYERGKLQFNQKDGSSYIDMILSILKEHYNDEFEMLKFLAIGDYEQFKEFAQISPEYTNHLIGYNILDQNSDSYFFKIESVKQRLAEMNKFKKINLTNSEKLAEISERRNIIEPKLRLIIRTVLRSNLDENNAKQKVLDIMGTPRSTKYYSYSLKDIFNANKSEIYFEDLRKVISKEWQYFENIFGKDKSAFNTHMEAINKYRADTHAKEIEKGDMEYFRVCAGKIEAYIEDFL